MAPRASTTRNGSSSGKSTGSGSMSKVSRQKVEEFAGTRVLVIEDDRSLAKMLSKQLRRNGFDVTCAVTGSDALRLLGVSESSDPAAGGVGGFDFVTCDFHLPDMTGIEILRQLRSSGQPLAHVPVLALTGDGSKQA